jgi:sirohydrochlorin cobaltochelatase
VKSGVMLCGHGSRDGEAIAEFELLASGLRARLPETDIATGYLEFARPLIRDGLEALAQRGAQRILAVPCMLFAASHVKNDLPWELNSFAATRPDIELRYGRDLAIEPKLLAAAAERIEAAERAAPRPVPRADTLLLVVGRGTNDPDANSNIAKLARMLWEGMGFGWAETCFSGVASPLVEPGLRQALRLGFRRIIVFPYFLFTGVLVKRVYAASERIASGHPYVEILNAPYLGVHPLVLDSFVDRARETVDGEPAMNCRLCKYRAQVIGYEHAAGAAQEGHHHHVSGIGPGHTHAHTHAHHPHRPDGT